MESVEVRPLTEEEYVHWDQLVRRSSQGSIFHSSDWLSTCADSLNKKLQIYGCFKKGQIVAGCSFFTLRRYFAKMAYTNLATTPYSGIILPSSQTDDGRKDEAQNIMDALRIALENMSCSYILLSNSPYLVDVSPFTSNGWKSIINYTYYLDLNNYGGHILKRLRWTVNKAKKIGVTAEKSEDIPLFYRLLEDTFMRQNLGRPTSEDFYKNMFSLLQKKNQCELWIAKTKSGEASAAEIIVYDEKRAYRWSAASHTELRKTGAPSLLLYEVLKDLGMRGFKEIDLMGGPPYIVRFLDQFKPTVVPYCSLEWKGSLLRIAGNLSHALKLN
jgi:hypothetical protein